VKMALNAVLWPTDCDVVVVDTMVISWLFDERRQYRAARWVGDQTRVPKLDSSDVGVAGWGGPERVVGIVDDFCHGRDEPVGCLNRKPVHLFQCPGAQFGPVFGEVNAGSSRRYRGRQ